jgi:aromatic ring-opening dioxygenase catalytic subunit (LigB family)
MRAVSIFVPHGGGPMPLLGDPSHTQLIKYMTGPARKILGSPSAIVLVTAHWETPQPTISAAESHKLLFDYYGFPPESYKLTYAAPGSPSVAQDVFDLLKKEGFTPDLDMKRGWDHGVFVPLLLMVPDASIPVVQVSVLASQDAAQLIRMGKALSPLLDKNIAIVGSGMSYHNLPKFMSGQSGSANKQFEADLGNAAKLGYTERCERLAKWRSWPGSYDCHPEGAAEHFSPLIVCAAAGDKHVSSESQSLFNTDVSAHVWQ